MADPPAPEPEGEWWQNQWGEWKWWPKTSTSTSTTAATSSTEVQEQENDYTAYMRPEAPTQDDGEEDAPPRAHPSDVLALARGSEERAHIPNSEWDTQLRNIIKSAKMGAAVSYSAVQRVLRQVENDPILIDSQEGGVCEENEPLRVLHQILRHVLQQAETAHITNDIIFVGEEYLDLMQDILVKNDRPR